MPCARAHARSLEGTLLMNVYYLVCIYCFVCTTMSVTQNAVCNCEIKSRLTYQPTAVLWCVSSCELCFFDWIRLGCLSLEYKPLSNTIAVSLTIDGKTVFDEEFPGVCFSTHLYEHHKYCAKSLGLVMSRIILHFPMRQHWGKYVWTYYPKFSQGFWAAVYKFNLT